MRPVLDPVAQHVDHAALGDLALQAGQELAPRRAVLAEVERLCDFRLRRLEEGAELGQIHAVLAIVVLGVSVKPARTPVGRRRLGDTAFRAGVSRSPVIAATMRPSRPFSLVSVVTPPLPAPR